MENNAVLFTAASLGFIHTLLGPDHYVPFVALARARSWSKTRTAAVTFLCGLGLALSAAAVFSAATMATMLVSVFLLLWGVKLFPAERLERYAHALAGFSIFACGVAVRAGL